MVTDIQLNTKRWCWVTRASLGGISRLWWRQIPNILTCRDVKTLLSLRLIEINNCNENPRPAVSRNVRKLPLHCGRAGDICHQVHYGVLTNLFSTFSRIHQVHFLLTHLLTTVKFSMNCQQLINPSGLVHCSRFTAHYSELISHPGFTAIRVNTLTPLDPFKSDSEKLLDTVFLNKPLIQRKITHV